MNAIVLKTDTPEYGEAYLVISYSDERPMNSRYDACLEYALYALDKRHELDSGTLEYNSWYRNYGKIENAIPDMLEHVFGYKDVEYGITGLGPGVFGSG